MATAARLKKKAKAARKSLNDIAHDALRAAARPIREEAWVEADRFRDRLGVKAGGDLSDSTADIREDRHRH
jgi:hypothetical protein